MSLLLALQFLSSGSAQSQSPACGLSGANDLEWVVRCRRGEDGFASNCVTTAYSPPFVLRLSTADSQLSVSILHPECEEVRYFERVDVIGLSSSHRAELIASAFADAAAALHLRCPHLPKPEPKSDKAPDISLIGDTD